jgi:preprotein translocase subunit SecG
MVMIGILKFLLVLISIVLLGLILIQRGKGGGLSGVFGGGGVEQAFGTRAATMAQKATAILGALFLILCVWLGILWGSNRSDTGNNSSDQNQQTRDDSSQGGE